MRDLEISTLISLAALPRRCWDELKLRDFYRTLRDIPPKFAEGAPLCQRLLLDGHFLNPGYFYRMQLFRAALNSHLGNELGFVWRHNTGHCSRALKLMGVDRTHFFLPRSDPRLRKHAHKLANGIRSSDDLLNMRFPYDVPAPFLYDYVLKCQRAATVNASDPLIEKHIWDFLSSIHAAEELLDSYNPDFVGMSHSISLQCAPLAWLSAQRGIPVVMQFGNYGLPRYWRMHKPEDIYFGMDRPERHDLEAIIPAQAKSLAEVGRQYLSVRLSGQTNDLGGRMAFSGRKTLSGAIGSGDGRPIVAVYASNWFDFPHALGMKYFRDFLDWIEATLQIAIATPSVRWLFRAHPCDKWYGGMTLKDVMPANLPDHVSLLSDDCSGSVVMELADALVTHHGTAAIEFASQGKPVLVADRGWYHDCGFTVFPESREHYLDLLGRDWFNLVGVEAAQRNAEVFAGMYFCNPAWQIGATLPDDADRELLIQSLPDFLAIQEASIRREVATIREWLAAGSRGYHTFKMGRSESYALSNVSK